jgi:hypothetical protein
MIDELAARVVPVVLANITTLYPYHDSHLTVAAEAPHDPFAAHPAFGNSFDWHSSVHSHWTAIQLLEYFSNKEQPKELEALQAAVTANLKPERIAAEQAYLSSRPSYERPYGWAWAMKLAAAAPSLRSLAEWIAQRASSWLDVLPMPVRHGVHSNTAFALGLMYDAALYLQMESFRNAIAVRTREWFATDRNWPAHYERSGNDFLSPGLTEADLMRRVLAPNEFATWWSEFLPSLRDDSPLLVPVRIPDVEDGHIVHLHGLNLSRAAALARIGKALQTPLFIDRARALYDASVDRVATGYYTETHWLPTFAWDAAVALFT